MNRTAAPLVGLFLVGCSLHHPIVMTAIRIDSVRTGATPPVVTPVRFPSTVSDDPLRRVDRMDWPGPNSMRLSSGAPGPDYWQQRADYTVAATLDTAAKSIRGTVSIRYTNNSPDTLHYVWIQL